MFFGCRDGNEEKTPNNPMRSFGSIFPPLSLIGYCTSIYKLYRSRQNQHIHSHRSDNRAIVCYVWYTSSLDKTTPCTRRYSWITQLNYSFKTKLKLSLTLKTNHYLQTALWRTQERTTNLHTWSHIDAKTSAPAWPNLSSMCVSGRSYFTDPEAAKTQPQDDTHSEG